MKFLLVIAIVLSSFTLCAQTDFCLSLTDIIKIENVEDIPVVSDNGDGTVTLTHPDQDITDLFASYTIYGLEQAFPSSTNEETLKFYYLKHSSRALVMDIDTTISETIYAVDNDFTSEFPFVNDFISFIDGKQYNYSGYATTDDNGGCSSIETCSLITFSDDFDLSVLFSYDDTSQTLFIETTSPSSCGNEFKIGFKPGVNEMNGGNSSGQIQEWSIENVVVSQGNSSDDCFIPETFLNDIFGVGCDGDSFFGNISMFYASGQEKIRFFRENALFFTGIVEFRDPELGIEKSVLNDISIFQRMGAEQIQIVNSLSYNLSSTIYTTEGKVIIDIASIEDDVIDISMLSQNQLYIIELETEDRQRKLVKFLKR